MHLPRNSTSIHAQPDVSGESKKWLSGRRLLVARISLLAITILNLIIYAVGTPVYFAQLFPSHHHCYEDCLTSAHLQTLHTLGISITASAIYQVTLNLLFAIVYFAVAVLIFWRKSDDLMALLASFCLVALGASFPDIPAVLAAAHPVWHLPVTLVSEGVIGFPSLILFFFLFPDGRFVPGWTRWIVVGAALLFIPGSFFSNSLLNPSNWPRLLFLPVPIVIFGSLVVTQVNRYRRISTPVQRQQTKWIVYGAAVALLGFLLLGNLLPALVRLNVPLQSLSLLPSLILLTSIYLILLLIPLSLAIAILRYRLWDVDVLINKTLVYGLLSGTLAAVYAGCIIGLQALFRGIFNQNSDVAIVVSTLVIAALFQPLRQSIQSAIDRRKYDAAQTLAAFSETLRQEVDLDQLCGHVLAVVQETMQPAHISLWLRPPAHDGTQRAPWRATSVVSSEGMTREWVPGSST
jgi:hypothetical protein